MTVVVVGASGAVGRLLAPYWKLAKAPVLLQYRGAFSPWAAEMVLKWNPDDGPDALIRWVSSHKTPTCMIVLAGVTPRSDKALSENQRIAETCLAAARSVAIPRVIVASSSAVYGDYLDRPFSEADEPRPVSPYGTAKLIMERACEKLAAPNLQVTCLRIGNVAGADALLSRIDPSEDKQVVIDRFEDGGTPLRSYMGPGTLAETLMQLARYDGSLPPTLNMAAPKPVEMAALADAAGIRWRPRPRTKWSGQRITLDCTRLWNLLVPPPRASEPEEMLSQLELSRIEQ